MRFRGAAVAFAWLLAGCATPLEPPPPVAAAPAPKPTLGTFGIDLAGMDRSVRPGDDFWSYVNGTWAKTTVIPPDRGSLSQVNRLNDVSSAQVRVILDELAAKPGRLQGEEQQISDYYAGLMDQAALDTRGVAPLQAELAPVRAVSDKRQLATLLGQLSRTWMGTPPIGRMPRYRPTPFSIGVGQDSKQPDRYMPEMGQSGLGMPNRDYYLKTDAGSAETQAKYRAHIAAMLRLAGAPEAEAPARAQAVYDLERKLAELHVPLAEAREADKNYNPWTRADFASKAPGFDWPAFLAAAGYAEQPVLIVGQPAGVAGAAKLLGSEPLGVWKDWITLRLAKDRAAVLPKAFSDEEFAFSGGVLGGATEPPARWLQAVELTAAALTDPVSKPYIARHFPPATKAAMDDLVRNVLAAMDRRLQNLVWMAPDTKAKARAKLAAFTPYIGYPDTWRDYSGLRVEPGRAYENFVRAARFHTDRDLNRLGRPVDRGEWWMMPITANAYASFENNQIVFPAGYLQAPHFDAAADPAVNYGAIGYVIGHEISHHFDDQGRKFDPQGRLIDWWTAEDATRFRALTDRLVAQYDAYEALPGLNVRGAQTLGENIADNAGLAVAYDAYRMSLNGREAPVLEGFTGDQRFFMGRAQMNRVLFREPALRQQVISGVHSPSKFRTFSVRNHDAWYDAFDVAPGQAMYLRPEDRVRIW